MAFRRSLPRFLSAAASGGGSSSSSSGLGGAAQNFGLRPLASSAASSSSSSSSSSSAEEEVLRSAARSVGLPRIDEAFPGVPELAPGRAQDAPATRITTLDNGLRVLSLDTYAQTACMGIFVNTGSRMETADNRGVAHFLELMALKTTKNRSSKELGESLEWLGATPTCSSARDHLMYTLDVPRENAAASLEILADAVLHPALTEEDVAEEKLRIPFMREAFEMDSHMVMVERLFEAGFGSTSAVGQPSFCPPHSVQGMTPAKIRSFMDQWYVATEMVLVGINVDHDEFVGMARDNFSQVAPVALGGATPAIEAARATPTYTGGELQVKTPDPHGILEGFSHVGIAFETHGWDNMDDVYAACVLHSLFGGGDAFSAGGPGKGMYSRLFQQVLNRYYWVESCLSVIDVQSDTGLLGIRGSCPPEHLQNMSQVIIMELGRVMNREIGPVELERARNQVRCVCVCVCVGVGGCLCAKKASWGSE